MKIFISHASANKEYGAALVELLRGIGIQDDEIVFTSDVAYGIPNGANTFHWLKSQISKNPYIIYLLSPEYYQSIACLNEMGAAWIVENEHTIIFTPNFSASNSEFQKGALDPRKMGFHINDEDRLVLFIDQLKAFFKVTTNAVLIHQKIRVFLKNLASIKDTPQQPHLNDPKEKSPIEEKAIERNPLLDFLDGLPINSSMKNKNPVSTTTSKFEKSEQKGLYGEFLLDIRLSKLNDGELILLHYVIETARTKLRTGWQEESEIQEIKMWEEIQGLNNLLSLNYNSIVRRLGVRKYTEVSATTSSGNPKEVALKHEIAQNILDLPKDVLDIIGNAIEKNKLIDDSPF